MKRQKNKHNVNDDAYAEAQRQIAVCREKNRKKLDLSHSELKEIPPEIADLQSVEELNMTNDSIESIPSEIANLKNLRHLIIHGEKITTLPHEIGEKLSLTDIDLECPKLKTLPESFANLKTIKEFLFHRCNMTAIPTFVCGWTKLEKFELSMDNTFQGPYTDLTALPRNIGNLKNLKYLKLEGVNIKKNP